MAHPIRDIDSQNAPLPNNNPFADPVQVECLPEEPDGKPPLYHLHTPPGSDLAQGSSDRRPSIPESDLHWELDDIRHLLGVLAYDTAFGGHDDSDTAPRDDARGTIPKQPGHGDNQAKRSTAGTSQSKTID